MNDGDVVMVRSRDAGVFCGTLVERDGDEVLLRDARRVWYWDGAATLSELATLGTAKPESCRFPAPVPEVLVLGVCEMIPVSEAAATTIAAVPVWTEHE